MKRKIPDLRADHDYISLDHCYVLIEQLGEATNHMEAFAGIAEHLDPEVLKFHLQRHFTPDAFSKLYETERGKGLLIGTFAMELLNASNAEGDSHEEY